MEEQRETDTKEADELGCIIIRDGPRAGGVEMGTRDQELCGRRTSR